MIKNKILFLICIEGGEANTENNLFICLNQNQTSNIVFHQLSSIGHNDKALDWKRETMLQKKVYSEIFNKENTFVECIIFSDGDLKGNQWKAIENTYNVIRENLEQWFNKMKNINEYKIWDHQYDKGQDAEYFLWLLNPNTTREEVTKAISSNSISSTKEKSLKAFYCIEKISELKKRDFKLWNKYYAIFKQEHESESPPRFVDVLSYALKGRKEFYNDSCYFKIFECVNDYLEEAWGIKKNKHIP